MTGSPSLDTLLRGLEDATRRATRNLERLGRGARHALVTDSAPPPTPTPRLEVWARDKVRLYRYRTPEGVTRRDAPPVLFVMSLVTTSLVFDLQEGNSLVRRFLDDGYDVFLLDWGVPDVVDSANTLETYCDEYLPRAVAATLREAGQETVTVLGYCLGAVLALLSVAGHPAMPVTAMILLATPIRMDELGPLTAMLKADQIRPDDLVDWTGNVPPARIKESFHLVEPAGEISTLLSLWNSLADPERLAAHDALIRWSSGHIPFAGGAFRQIDDLFIHRELLVEGTVPLGRRTVDLADIRIPVLAVTGARDKLVPAASSDPLALPGADLERLVLDAGHAGLLLGRKAHRETIPAMLAWLADQQPDGGRRSR